MIIKQNDFNEIKETNPNKSNSNKPLNLILRSGIDKDILYSVVDPYKTKVYCLNKFILNKLNIPIKYQTLIYGGKTLNKDSFLGDYDLQNGSLIDLSIPIKGGLLGIDDVINFFKDIWGAMKAIGKFFGKTIPLGILDIVKIIYWIFKLILWFVTDILNPVIWVEDGAKGIFNVIIIIIMGMVEIVLGLIREVFNYILEPIFSSFWGHGNNNKVGKCKKCFSTRAGKLPFSVIIGTILLPPLGVFMELGISGWINIVVCVLLTLAFYFPGLIYALILLTC